MGKTCLFSVFCILFAFVLLGSAFSLDIDSYIYDLGEQIFFVSCADTVNVSCLDSGLVSHEWQDGCHIYAFDSANLSCVQPVVMVDGGKANHSLLIKNYHDALSSTLNSTNASDPETLAIKAYANYLFGDYDEVDNLLESLKGNRDPQEKCWPQGNCDIETTIDVLLYLARADVNRSKRIYDDALHWIESKQHKEDNEDWVVEVTADPDTDCDILQDTTSLASFIMDGNESKDYKFDYSADQDLNTSCDDEFCVYIYDEFGYLLFDQCGDDNHTVNFNMKGSCWFRNDNLTICDARVTSKAVLINQLDKDTFSDGKAWLNNHLYRTRIVGKNARSSSNILTNIYAYNATKSADSEDWLLFSQNNDGSFGDSDSHFTTLEAIRVFKEKINIEWISDAVDWINSERPGMGWDDLELDTIQYELFQNPALVITSDPLMIVTDSSADFRLSPQSLSNVTVNLSSSLNGIVSLNFSSDLNKGKVRVLNPKDGFYYGFVNAFTGSYLKKIPVIVKKLPSFSLDVRDSYFVFDESGQISVPVKKSDSDLSCFFGFDRFFSNVSIDVGSVGELVFDYTIPDKEVTSDVMVSYDCKSKLGPLSGDRFFVIRKFPGPPYKYELDPVEIDEDPGVLWIRNLLDEEIVVSLSLEKQTDLYPLPEVLTLQPGEEAKVYVYQSVPSDKNFTDQNTVIIDSLGYKVDIPFSIYLDDTPHEVDQAVEISAGSVLVPLGVGSVGLAILVCLSYMLFNRDKSASGKVKASKVDSHTASDSMAEVLAAVDKRVGESDQQISAELETDGYKKDQIQKIFEKLNSDLASLNIPAVDNTDLQGSSSGVVDKEKKL